MHYYKELGSEGFLPIPFELEGYEAGENGTILSWRSRNGRGFAKKPRVIKGWIASDGYKKVRLADHRNHRVSILVATAFLEPVEGKEYVLHNNGDCLDNRLVNLRYGTHAENMKDMVAHGRSQTDRNWFKKPKLEPSKVIEIRSLHKEGASINSLAKLYEVERNTIRCIIRNITWKHVV